VRLQGQSPAGIGWPRFRRRVVLVDQRPALLPGSVLQNLARPFQYAIATSAFDPGRARRLLERLGLATDLLDQPARTLSQGEQQRVCLARALLLRPPVLLLDEPTSALDEAALAKSEQIVRELAERRGVAALIVTHLAAQAARWCDRIFHLEPHIVTPAGEAGRQEVKN